MDTKEVQRLIKQKRYKEAAELLDRMLTKDKENADLWFLRGVVSLKLRSYDVAHENIGMALLIDEKPEYHRMKGIAHFEVFELEDAIKEFRDAIGLDEKDATSHFFLSMAYMFADDPRSEAYLKKAKELNGRKTRQLLKNFYSVFLKKDPSVSDAQKRKIEGLISSIK